MQRSRSSEDLRTILHCSLQAPPSAHKRSLETSERALTKVMDCCNMAYLGVTFIHRCTLSNLAEETLTSRLWVVIATMITKREGV